MSSWELVSHRYGGTVAALATAVDAEGQAVVFAASGVGVHQSDDGGRSWTTLSAGALPPPTEALALSPRFGRDGTLFAGGPNGVARSTDGGRTWQMVLVGSRVLGLATTTSGDDGVGLFAATETDGILRSDDRGRSWSSANPGLLDLAVLALALSPRFERDRTGFAATASGLYRTRNGGRAWRAVELPLVEPAAQCLAVSPDFATDGFVLAGTEADGLLRSRDGGASWETVPELAGRSVTAVAFSTTYPTRPTVAAACDGGVYVSEDAGLTWRPSGVELGPVLSLGFAPIGGEVLLAGLPRRGVARLGPDREWEPANEGLDGSLVVGLRLSPTFSVDRTLFTYGLEDGVAVSTDGGARWAARNAGLVDTTVFDLALSPRFAKDRVAYAATAAGLCRSSDGGTGWRVVLEGSARAVAVGLGETGRPALVLAALGAGRLALSEDGGDSWRGLAWPGEGTDLLALACSPGFAQDRTLFVGAGGPHAPGTAERGLVVWRSTDGGARWQRWLITRGPGVLPLVIAPEDERDKTVFAGVGRRVLRPMRNMTEVRGGERRPSWRETEAPGMGTSVLALAVSPEFARDGVVVAAGGEGIAISRDSGATFSGWGEGLRPGPVVGVAVSPEYARDRLVYALGLGGAVWRRVDRSRESSLATSGREGGRGSRSTTLSFRAQRGI